MKNPTKVLIADDEASITAGLSAILSDEGYTVDIANDGQKALERMREERYGVILADLKMPKLDGLGLLRAIRSHPPIQKTAFIMLTGRADKELVQRAVQFGVNNYLVKPFTVAQLKGKLEAVFGPLT